MTLYKNLDANFSIVQLTYCSYATDFEDKPEFERNLLDILDHSHAYNLLHDVTGALMTDGRMFAHVVEGLPAAVRTLYSKIVRDKRHDRVLTLQHVLVHVRLFGLYPIAFLRVGAVPHAAALDARSTPVELGKAAGSVLRAFRPILLK